MTSIDWNNLEKTITSMSDAERRRLLQQIQQSLQTNGENDALRQRKALDRLRRTLRDLSERDRFAHRGFTDREHDAIVYDEDQR